MPLNYTYHTIAQTVYMCIVYQSMKPILNLIPMDHTHEDRSIVFLIRKIYKKNHGTEETRKTKPYLMNVECNYFHVI